MTGPPVADNAVESCAEFSDHLSADLTELTKLRLNDEEGIETIEEDTTKNNVSVFTMLTVSFHSWKPKARMGLLSIGSIFSIL